MSQYTRWTRHRLNDGNGNDYQGLTPINLMWVASAAAEETLQGSPLAGAWLNLFSTQLSQNDPFWLRWAGDMAESTELRRAYSGLYGRFFARALLQQHLGFTSFLSLGRDGVEITNSVTVKRDSEGDIPDWIAWCPHRNRHVLGEAKGTLTAKDFLNHATPKCVVEGKKQFERVSVFDGHIVKNPLKWVAASRWATDLRTVAPATALFDPPEDDVPYNEHEVHRHREAMHRAWLGSLAPGFGLRGAEDFMSDATRDRRMVIIAEPGGMEHEADAKPPQEGVFPHEVVGGLHANNADFRERMRADPLFDRRPRELREHENYADGRLLVPHGGERAIHFGLYVSAAITRFGIQPLHADNTDSLRRLQDRAREGTEPAMVVGIPICTDAKLLGVPKMTWLDAAGIVDTGGLAVFDLRKILFDFD